MTMDNTKNTQNISKLVMDLISAPVEFALSSVPSTDDSYFIKMLKHERNAMYDTLIACSSWLNNGEGKVMYVRDWTNPIKDVVSITLSKDAIYITENQECRIRRCDLNKQEILTKRQSWMLPDLSVQRKTPNGPKLKSLTYCVICYIMYIS